MTRLSITVEQLLEIAPMWRIFWVARQLGISDRKRFNCAFRFVDALKGGPGGCFYDDTWCMGIETMAGYADDAWNEARRDKDKDAQKEMIKALKRMFS